MQNNKENSQKVVVVCGPSGVGKGTLVRFLMAKYPNFVLSVSDTTREKSEKEIDGVHYNFISVTEFKKRIIEDAFFEYEEVYPNKFYGTSKNQIVKTTESETKVLDTKIPNEKNLLFDVDIKGAISIKKHFGENALTIFLTPPKPHMENLRTRMTERAEKEGRTIDEVRLSKAPHEIALAESELVKNNKDDKNKSAEKSGIDFIITNDDDKNSYITISKIIEEFLS